MKNLMKKYCIADALIKNEYDFAYIHVEAPDEMGHQGSAQRKVEAIEYLDQKVIGPLVQQLENSAVDFRMLILPDHPTPVRLRTHTAGNVPYLLYDSTLANNKSWSYNEKDASKSGNMVEKGHCLIEKLFER